MKVKELIAELKTRDQDAIVVCSADPEGNYFNELRGLGAGDWDSSQRVLHDESYDAEDCCMDNEEYAEMRTLPKCVVLWP